MRIKRFLCAVLSGCALLSASPPAYALSGVSAWARSEVSLAQEAGLEPTSLQRTGATAPITRAEFCDIALALYEKASGKKPVPSSARPFSDTNNASIATAEALGLVSGRGDGIFDPHGAITRQELCKLLDNVLAAAGQDEFSTGSEPLDRFPDHSKIASWAAEPIERMLDAKILRGVSRQAVDPTGEATTVTELCPTGTTTREQALILALRFSWQLETPPQIETAPPNISNKPDQADPDEDTEKADKPAEKPEAQKPAEKPAETPAETPTDSPKIPEDEKTETPTDAPEKTPQSEDEKMVLVFGEGGTFFETPEIAEAAMAEISVPVWRLVDGKKTPGKAHVTVNRNLSATYTLIFMEIYNGDEQFPISDVGSYAWRASPTSEHRWGTAIDLNYDANMEATINADGTLTPTTGTHWSPGEDPFSIPEDGDVVNAFSKYGFSWGGNAWKNKRDYMHFSYFGR